MAADPLTGAERALVGLELGLAAGAFGGAIGLTSGAMDLGELTDELPLRSPVLAGVALGTVNGVLPTAVAIGTLRRRGWSRRGHVVTGVALIGWIAIQLKIIGPKSWLQPACAAYGVLIVMLAHRVSRR